NYGDLFLKTINKLSPQEIDMLYVDNIIDEKYLGNKQLTELKKALNTEITTDELKEILIKTLFTN
ncbi:MAG: hypothetical protein ACRCXS_02020, partial [Cetobacterium sp.]